MKFPLGIRVAFWSGMATFALAGCAHSGKMEELAATTHAQLAAEHYAMESVHHHMAQADSTMQAEHAAALATAKAQNKDQTPAFQVLETRHRAFMALCLRVTRRHEQVLARHRELEKSHTAGQVTATQMEADHAAMQAEDEQMQQEHQQLVEAHQKMEREHAALLK